MEYIGATHKILYYRSLECPINKEWIDWAVEMIEAGFETENLLYLASFDPIDNQFRLQEIADKAFRELHIDFFDKKLATKNYVIYLVESVKSRNIDHLKALHSLKEIYLDSGMPRYLQDFHLLYWAKDDLKYSDHQWYWDGANKDNIDVVIKDYFENWKID